MDFVADVGVDREVAPVWMDVKEVAEDDVIGGVDDDTADVNAVINIDGDVESKVADVVVNIGVVEVVAFEVISSLLGKTKKIYWWENFTIKLKQIKYIPINIFHVQDAYAKKMYQLQQR